MSEPAQRLIETNGIRLNIAEQGRGPLVLMCHGFPESWYSWRHQIDALAAAGFHAIAPDLRGYGKSDRPEAIDQYTIFHLIGDLIGLLDALQAPTAVIVGHDWGAYIAWQAARLRPDRFRAVACLSVPYPPARSRAPDQRHAAHRRGSILSIVLSGARRRRSRTGARSADDRAHHALWRVR